MQKFENRLRFDKVTESFKVGTFLRHNVDDGCITGEQVHVPVAVDDRKYLTITNKSKLVIA